MVETAGIERFPNFRESANTKATTARGPVFTLTSQASETDLTDLPARLQAIAATMGAMLSDGYSKAEIARYFAKSRPWVSARLQELEVGLRELVARSTGSTGSESRDSSK